MKVLNVTESTVFLDDINMPVYYTRTNETTDIPEALAQKSKTLRMAMQEGMILDVTQGIPAVIPRYENKPRHIAADPESPYFKKKAMLTEVDHSKKAGDNTVKTRPAYNIRSEETHAVEQYGRDGQMSVIWGGPAQDAGGYARMNRKFMFGLSDLGVQVRYDTLPSMPDMEPEIMARLTKLTSTRVPSGTPKVYGMTAPMHYEWDKYKLLFTMMETRRLHPGYVERCNCADEVVVPSRWCEQVFRESGVRQPMSVVPLGVDLNIYHPDAEPIEFTRQIRPFVFLSVFGWSLRKGYDVLLKAYLEEFTSDDPVTLLISSRYFGSTDETKKQVIRNDVAKVSAFVKNQKKPHVMLFGDVLSDQMMPRLFAAADCYVLPTRGEGFGLPYLEAGACRLPVIATRYSGQTDFLDDDNSWLIDVDGFRSAERELAWISYFYENAEFPILGPKAVEQLRHCMREAFEKKELAEQKANRLHEKVVREYGWPTAIQQMHDKLKATFDVLAKR